MKAIATGLCLVLATSCGGAHAASTANSTSRATNENTTRPGRSPTAQEQSTIDTLSHQAEQLRGLHLLRPVPAIIQSEEQIRAFVESKIDEETDEIRESVLVYEALNMLPHGTDIRALLGSVLGEQIAGYYDDERGEMVIRESVAQSLGGTGVSEARMTLVHEYVHALQDQHLHLGTLHARTMGNDESNAFASLVEGDATLTMLGVAAPLNTLIRVPNFGNLVRASMASNTATQSALHAAPAVVREPLLSHYIDGMLFNAALYRENGFASINAAFEHLPQTTEQVLHPEKYLAHELGVALSESDFPLTGYPSTSSLVLGELEGAVFLGRGGTPVQTEAANRAAAGWGGDIAIRYDAPTSIPQWGAVWYVVFDSENDAIELQQLPVETGWGQFRQGRVVARYRNLIPSAESEVQAHVRRLSGVHDALASR